MGYRIQVGEPGRQGLVVDINSRVEVGREVDDLRLLDPTVSRRHVELIPQADGLVVRDLGSTAGTLLNGRRIDSPTVLKVGDAVSLGNSVLTVLTAAAPPSAVSNTDRPDAGATDDWYRDPTGRFELRYVRSGAWTEHVSTAGQTSVDPLDTPQQDLPVMPMRHVATEHGVDLRSTAPVNPARDDEAMSMFARFGPHIPADVVAFGQVPLWPLPGLSRDGRLYLPPDEQAIAAANEVEIETLSWRVVDGLAMRDQKLPHASVLLTPTRLVFAAPLQITPDRVESTSMIVTPMLINMVLKRRARKASDGQAVVGSLLWCWPRETSVRRRSDGRFEWRIGAHDPLARTAMVRVISSDWASLHELACKGHQLVRSFRHGCRWATPENLAWNDSQPSAPDANGEFPNLMGFTWLGIESAPQGPEFEQAKRLAMEQLSGPWGVPGALSLTGSFPVSQRRAVLDAVEAAARGAKKFSMRGGRLSAGKISVIDRAPQEIRVAVDSLLGARIGIVSVLVLKDALQVTLIDGVAMRDFAGVIPTSSDYVAAQDQYENFLVSLRDYLISSVAGLRFAIEDRWATLV